MKETVQKYLAAVWPAIIWSAIIFVLLILPARKFPDEQSFTVPQFDKIVHALLFFILVVLWAYYYKGKTGARSFSITILLIAALAIAYGIIMEYIQMMVGRDFEAGDIVADGAGAVLGWLYAVKKISPGRNRGRNQN